MINLSVKIPKLNLDKESSVFDNDRTTLSNLIKYDPEFKQLLKSSDYKNLYSHLDLSAQTGLLTRLLYSLDIDVLLYLESVPKNFLYNQYIPIQVNVPDNIKSLKIYSFSDSGLGYVSLPANLNYIDKYSFFNVPYLNTIAFRGTKQEWKDLRKAPDWISDSTKANVKVVKCIDGEIKL